jgi:hypothetical protein
MKTKIWIALIALYIVWGSTYLAIRFAVETIPPFMHAGMRFLISGLILVLWRRAAGDEMPTRIQWKSLAIIGTLIVARRKRPRLVRRTTHRIGRRGVDRWNDSAVAGVDRSLAQERSQTHVAVHCWIDRRLWRHLSAGRSVGINGRTAIRFDWHDCRSLRFVFMGARFHLQPKRGVTQVRVDDDGRRDARGKCSAIFSESSRWANGMASASHRFQLNRGLV